MKLLLTSAGIKNPSIQRRAASSSSASRSPSATPSAFPPRPTGTPRAAFAGVPVHHRASLDRPWRAGLEVPGSARAHRAPSIDEEHWVPLVEETDVLLVNGGDALYLAHWMRRVGPGRPLALARDTVWVGFSAGSMVMTPRIGEDFVVWRPPGGGDETLGIVDFSIFPHVDHPDLPENTMADGRTVGGRAREPGVCDRRRHRDQSGRRHRRGHLRGALAAVRRSKTTGQASSFAELGVQASSLCRAPLLRERVAELRRRDTGEPQAEAAAEEREPARRGVGVRDEEHAARESGELEQVVRADRRARRRAARAAARRSRPGRSTGSGRRSSTDLSAAATRSTPARELPAAVDDLERSPSAR